MIKSRTTIDRRGMQRANRARPAAREAAVRAMAHEFIGYILRHAPRDTNRYVRGWAEAGNKAGVGPFPVPAINKSSRHQDIIDFLVSQRDHWANEITRVTGVLNWWYYSKGKTPRGKTAQKLLADKRKAERMLLRANEQLQRALGADSLLLMDAGAAFVFRGVGYRARGKGVRKLATVRTKVYGGDGRIVNSGDRTTIILHNKEPHTTIVEKRDLLVAGARAHVKARGVRFGGAAYARKITISARMGRKA